VIFVTLDPYFATAIVRLEFTVSVVARLQQDIGGAIVMKSLVVKRSVVLAGHKTSVSLEDAFWKSLKEIAGYRHTTLSSLLATIDSERQHGNLSSAIRLFVLGFYREQLDNRVAREAAQSMMGRTVIGVS
jgi:predicted DNA-binding ribbon-helix-helix protein